LALSGKTINVTTQESSPTITFPCRVVVPTVTVWLRRIEINAVTDNSTVVSTSTDSNETALEEFEEMLFNVTDSEINLKVLFAPFI